MTERKIINRLALTIAQMFHDSGKYCPVKRCQCPARIMGTSVCMQRLQKYYLAEAMKQLTPRPKSVII